MGKKKVGDSEALGLGLDGLLSEEARQARVESEPKLPSRTPAQWMEQLIELGTGDPTTEDNLVLAIMRRRQPDGGVTTQVNLLRNGATIHHLDAPVMAGECAHEVRKAFRLAEKNWVAMRQGRDAPWTLSSDGS